MEPVPQDPSKLIRYTKNADFNDEVAAEYLERGLTGADIEEALQTANREEYLRLYQQS
jgi:hypothetical protein